MRRMEPQRTIKVPPVVIPPIEVPTIVLPDVHMPEIPNPLPTRVEGFTINKTMVIILFAQLGLLDLVVLGFFIWSLFQ